MKVLDLYGDKGKQWLALLPELIKQIEVTQGLSGLKPVKNLSYNYVLSGFQEARPVILKLSPDIDGLKREISALKAFSGFGVVQVLAESEGMLLLEQAVSGIPLKSFFPEKDEDAIHITCDCLRRLHQSPVPIIHVFSNVKDWLKVLDEDINIPAHYLHKARQVRDQLLNTSLQQVLLHGDLHHDNMLKNGDDWVVIDPKGVIGEPAYEVAAFIRNPIPELLKLNNAMSIISHRIACFAEILKLSEQRIFEWCYVQAVLAWAWALEDGCDVTYFQKLTLMFDR